VAGFRVEIRRSAARELDAVEPRAVRRRIVARIAALADEPRPHGVEKLAGGGSRWRLRQGACRILFEIDEAKRRVVVVRIGHRRDVYR
jgi:mRNA interferase RelE/StbE